MPERVGRPDGFDGSLSSCFQVYHCIFFFRVEGAFELFYLAFVGFA